MRKDDISGVSVIGDKFLCGGVVFMSEWDCIANKKTKKTKDQMLWGNLTKRDVVHPG